MVLENKLTLGNDMNL